MTKEQSSQIDTSLCLSSMTVSDYGADQRLSMTVVRSKTAKFVNDRAESRILDTGGRIFSLSLTWRWPLLLRHHLWKPCSLWFENENLQHWHWHWPFFTSNYWHWHHFIELTLTRSNQMQPSVCQSIEAMAEMSSHTHLVRYLFHRAYTWLWPWRQKVAAKRSCLAIGKASKIRFVFSDVSGTSLKTSFLEKKDMVTDLMLDLIVDIKSDIKSQTSSRIKSLIISDQNQNRFKLPMLRCSFHPVQRRRIWRWRQWRHRFWWNRFWWRVRRGSRVRSGWRVRRGWKGWRGWRVRSGWRVRRGSRYPLPPASHWHNSKHAAEWVIDTKLKIPMPVTDMNCDKERQKRKWKAVNAVPKVIDRLQLDLGPLVCSDAHALEGIASDWLPAQNSQNSSWSEFTEFKFWTSTHDFP